MTGRIILITLITMNLTLPTWALDKMKLNENLEENKVYIQKDSSAERKPSAVEEAATPDDEPIYGPGKLFRDKEEWKTHRERFYGRDVSDR